MARNVTTVPLRTRKDVESLLDTTLRKFREKLEENARTKGCFWCDDTNEEGLQNKCEGLQAFVYRFEDSPNELSKYFDLDKLKEEILSICEFIDDKGFIATPYLYNDLKNVKIDPPEFIDVPSYALTLLVGSREVLKMASKLSDEEDRKILDIIEKCLDWFDKYHIDGGGWTGLPTKSYTSIYATWSAVEALLYFLESCDDTYPERIVSKKEIVREMLNDVKNWIFNFAKTQKANWASDDSDFSSTHGINTIYGIAIISDLLSVDTLGNISEEELSILIKNLNHFLTLWKSFRSDIFKKAKHYFYASSTKGSLEQKIGYEDDSILLVATMTLSDFVSSFSNKLKTWVDSNKDFEDVFNKITAILPDLVDKMIEKHYRNGIWVDDPEKETFSIYVTERAIEALDAYADALDVIFKKTLAENLTEKIDNLTESLNTLLEKFNELNNTLREYNRLDARLNQVEEELRDISNKLAEVDDLPKRIAEALKHKSFRNTLADAISDVLKEVLPEYLEKIVAEVGKGASDKADEQSQMLFQLKSTADKRTGKSNRK